MFLVIEIQTSANGTVSMINHSYATRNEAEEQYHRILTFAAVSALPKHAAVMMSEEGFPLRHECYKHEAVAAEGETVIDAEEG